MIKQLRIRILWPLLVNGMLLSSCEKQEIYDLFPLKVGNEFYYTYEKTEMFIPRAHTKGIEIWKVQYELPQGDSIIYIIERKLNGTTIINPGFGDTIIINNRISQLVVSEKKTSSLISFWGFYLKRYQEVSQIELTEEGGTSVPRVSCIFKADSGLVSFSYYHPPNRQYYETLMLDSLKVLP